MTRVRYTYQENGPLSTKSMLAVDRWINVHIYFIPLRAEIYAVQGGESISVLTAKNLTQLKKDVKVELIRLGVKFDDECRTRINSNNEEYQNAK